MNFFLSDIVEKCISCIIFVLLILHEELDRHA